MATTTEDSFKVCGLCSQLVDESVELPQNMRSFLCGFLKISEGTLASKICLECYHRSMECRSFKERCDRAIHKLHKSALYSSMILGGSPMEIAAAQGRSRKDDLVLNEAERRTAAVLDAAAAVSTPKTSAAPAAKTPKTPASAKKEKAKPKAAHPEQQQQQPPPPPPVEILETPRSTRSSTTYAKTTPASGLRSKQAATDSGPKAAAPKELQKPGKTPKKADRRNRVDGDLQPKVIIGRKDRKAAEEFLAPPAPKAKAKAATPQQQQQKKSNDLKRRASLPAEAPKPKKAKAKQRTSSGRVIKDNRKKGFVFDDFIESGDEAAAVDSTDSKRRPSAEIVAKKSSPKVDKKAGVAAAAAAAAAASAAAFSGGAAKSDDDDDDEVDEDMEEIFPTVGPYQCEICQKITDTKQEFVDHIKKLHLEVVDEEVLRSLEGDLRKSRKKAEKAERAAVMGKKLSQLATKSPKRGKKLPTGTIESRTCKVCKTVLSTALKTDHDRHRKSKYCMSMAAAASEGTQDPLSTGPTPPRKGGRKGEETAEEVAQRTCQFCGKVLAKKGDLSSHYKTKACVAKQYEREAVTNGNQVIVDNAEADEEEGGYAVAEVEKSNENERESPPNLPSSTTNEDQVEMVQQQQQMHVEAKLEENVAKDQQVTSENSASSTTNKSPQTSSVDWLGGPITTIADTLSGGVQEGAVEEIMTSVSEEKEFVPAPVEILGNGDAQPVFVTETDGSVPIF